MGNDLAPQRFPWEPAPQPSTDETVARLQRDVLYMVTHTAIMVHSSRAELCMLVNTRRGQIVPRNEMKFADGTTLEFQDIGMPQVGISEMTVQELIAHVWTVAHELGLEIAP